MSERVKLWLVRIGHVVFYMLAFVLFASLLFPYNALKDSIVLQFNAEQRATNSPQQLAIDDLGWYWFTGVRAKGVELRAASTDPGKAPTVIKIDEVRGRIGVFGLLLGDKDVTFHLDVLGGKVDGSFELHGKDRAVELRFEGVDVHKLDMLQELIGLPVEGKLGGTITIALPEGKASKGMGKVDLELKDVAIGDGKAKLKGALDWPKLSVGNLIFEAEAKDGQLKISKFGASGKDLEVVGDGRVQMRELATESTLDVNLRFRIADAYKGKSDTTKNLFGAPGGGKAGDIELFVPEMKQAKQPDGFYAFHVQGLLGKPSFVPAGAGGSMGPFGLPKGVRPMP